jgi:hypothetical protein
MTSDEIAQVIDEAACYQCFGPITMGQMLILGMERRILLARNPAADVSAGSLIAYAKCYGCLGVSMFDMMEFALLDQISQA